MQKWCPQDLTLLGLQKLTPAPGVNLIDRRVLALPLAVSCLHAWCGQSRKVHVTRLQELQRRENAIALWSAGAVTGRANGAGTC